jgi:hypothetical protein
MMRFADRLQQANSNVHVRIVGASQEERSIPLLVLSNPGYADAADFARLGRP